MTQTLPGQADIDFVRKSEGVFYGDGTAALIEAIRDKLLALPKAAGPKAMAKATHEVLRDKAEAIGMNPDIETYMSETGPPGRRQWLVSWESGPFDWAIQASMVMITCTGRLVEPNYGFDLCFYEVE